MAAFADVQKMTVPPQLKELRVEPEEPVAYPAVLARPRFVHRGRDGD